MMTDTTIYGYYNSNTGEAFTPAEFEDELDRLGIDERWQGHPDQEFIRPLYYLEDDGNGLLSDGGEWIFQPHLEEHVVRDGWEVSGWGWDLDEVPELVDVAALHTGDDHVARTVQVDADYGHAVALVVDELVVALFTTPDTPFTYGNQDALDEIEVILAA
jgi:hypothetical protein